MAGRSRRTVEPLPPVERLPPVGAPLNRHPLNPCRIDRATGRTASGTGTRARRTLAATRPADADATAGGCRPVSGERLPVRLMAHTSNRCRLLNRHPSNGCRTSRKRDAGQCAARSRAHRSRAHRSRAARSNRETLNPCRLSNGCRIDRATGRTASGTGTRARRTLAATRPADADARRGGFAAFPSKRRGRGGHGCPCWRTVARPSGSWRVDRGELSNVRRDRRGAQIEGETWRTVERLRPSGSWRTRRTVTRRTRAG